MIMEAQGGFCFSSIF